MADTYTAEEVMKAMGSIAEEAVAKIKQAADDAVRRLRTESNRSGDNGESDIVDAWDTNLKHVVDGYVDQNLKRATDANVTAQQVAINALATAHKIQQDASTLTVNAITALQTHLLNVIKNSDLATTQYLENQRVVLDRILNKEPAEAVGEAVILNEAPSNKAQ